jgi:arylsulfatase A-like enzyme
MLRGRALSTSSTSRHCGIAVTLALLAAACAREERVPAEAVHLIAPSPGVVATTYTLADETRPVLALPAERRLDLPVSAGAPAAYTFTLPEDYSGDVIATGSMQKGKFFHVLAPQLLIRSRDPDGSPRATLTLPAAALGDGPAARLTLLLTTPPATPTVETQSDPVAIPTDARLEVAFGLSPAAGIEGAAPVTFEIAVQPDGGAEQKLWSIALPGSDTPRWNEATVPLTAVAGQKVRFAFRARAAGGGRSVILPLWADPTIVAPAVRPAARRNVILISIDTLRADRLEAYGAYRPAMPQIDAFARNAVTFTNTWSVWPETSGSHMSIFSSRYPSEHRVTSFIASPSPTIELLAERLRRAGYLTRAYTEDGGVWANAGFARGFSAYAERRSADFVYRGEVDAVFADGTRWVDAHADRTFFLFLHTYQVHGPYSPPDAYRGLFADMPGREPARDLALAYDQEARYADDHIGPFLAHLEKVGLRDKTIVIILSDHGEEFGEHGGTGHGRTLHQEVLRVPLVIAAPGLLAPARVTTPASLLDVAPTVLDLLGLEPITAHRGVSLVARARAAASGAASDPAEAARPLFAEVDRNDHGHVQQVAVRRNGATAITDLVNGGVTRCYAAEDRAELTPTDACPELHELIELHRTAAVPVGTAAPEEVTDPELIEKMRALGYIQ